MTLFVAGLRDLDSNLGAYPYDSLKRWVSLTNHVSETLVARYQLCNYAIISLRCVTVHSCKYRIQPLNGKISSVTQIVSEESRTKPSAPLHPIVEEPHVGSSQEPTSSNPTASSCEVTEGGVFAGIGHFPPTPKPGAQSSRCPPIRYKPDATLR